VLFRSKAAEGQERVTVTAPDGQVTGEVKPSEPGTVKIVGDDGLIHKFATGAEGIKITTEAPNTPLSNALEVAANNDNTPAPADAASVAPADAAPAPAVEAAPEAIAPAVVEPVQADQQPQPEPSPALTTEQPKTPALSEMDEDGLRGRLKYIADQAKANGGWNKMLVEQRRAVEKEINARAPKVEAPKQEEQVAIAQDKPDDGIVRSKSGYAQVKLQGKKHFVTPFDDQFVIRDGMGGIARDAANKPMKFATEADAIAHANANAKRGKVGGSAADVPETSFGDIKATDETGSQWTRATSIERQSIATRAGLSDKVANTAWDDLNGSVKKKLAAAMQPTEPTTTDLVQTAKDSGRLEVVVVGDKPKLTKMSKEEEEHLFGTEKKRAAALDRIAKGTAYFGSKEKAAEFIAKNGLKDTHTIEQTGKVRFEVKAKEASDGNDTGTVGKPASTKAVEQEADAGQATGAAVQPDAAEEVSTKPEPAADDATPLQRTEAEIAEMKWRRSLPVNAGQRDFIDGELAKLEELADLIKKTDASAQRVDQTVSAELQTAMEADGWAAEVVGPDNTIWTKQVDGDRFTALLTPATGSKPANMEVTVLEGTVDTQIASFEAKSAKETTANVNKAVAQAVAEAKPAESETPADWMAELFGGESTAPQDTPKPKVRRIPSAEKLSDALAKAKAKVEASIADWSGRVYKDNRKSVIFEGDGPTKNDSMSIGAINENHKNKAVQAFSAELKAIEAMQEALKTDKDANRLLNLLEGTMKQAETNVERGAQIVGKTADEAFEYDILQALDIRPAGGAFTSNGVSKALLSYLKDSATPAAEPPKKLPTAPAVRKQMEKKAAEAEAEAKKQEAPIKSIRDLPTKQKITWTNRNGKVVKVEINRESDWYQRGVRGAKEGGRYPEDSEVSAESLANYTLGRSEFQESQEGKEFIKARDEKRAKEQAENEAKIAKFDAYRAKYGAYADSLDAELSASKKKGDETATRKIRSAIFDAEDAAVSAIDGGNIDAFGRFKDLFPKTYAMLDNAIGGKDAEAQPVKTPTAPAVQKQMAKREVEAKDQDTESPSRELSAVLAKNLSAIIPQQQKYERVFGRGQWPGYLKRLISGNDVLKQFMLTPAVGDTAFAKIALAKAKESADLVRIADKLEKVAAKAKAEAEPLTTPTKAEIEAKQEGRKAPEKIEDFGQKLGGAKKDMAPSLDKELTDDEIATKPLSQIWPANEVDGIKDQFAAAVSFAARAEIPAKPRVGYKVKAWVQKVKNMRSLVQDLLVDGKVTPEQFMAELRKVSSLSGFADKVTLLNAIDRSQWSRINEVRAYPNAYRMEDGKQIPSPLVHVEIDGQFNRFGGAKTVDDVVERVNELLGTAADGKKLQFEIRQNTKTMELFIIKKGDKEFRKLKTFKQIADARAYVKNNYDELVAAWDAIKESDNVKKTDVRSEVNRARTGEDRRGGKDVTPEQFGSMFGFRGVEFGNWVGQGANAKERQGMLNQAYDALLDLADIVGIPPKAISLNGTMGLAFGSRGSGKFAAHFEPGNLVINLTKTKGAGSLAHEWFHALDNYFARQRGGEMPMQRGANARDTYRSNNFITYRPEPLYIHKSKSSTPITKTKLKRYRDQNPTSEYYNPDNWQVDPKHPNGVRPEVERAFADVVEALDESPMAKRAASLDKTPEAYWSQIIERGARAFENYVITKMMEKGYQNDYLANVRPIEDFPRSRDRYPYLLPEEVAPIAQAFDVLFGTIQTKETDKGVMLFSKANTEPTGNTVSAINQSLKDEGLDKNNIKVVQSLSEADAKGLEDGRLSQIVYHGTPYRGIDKFSTDKMGTGEGFQAFGWGLYFAGKKDVAEYYRDTLKKGATVENVGRNDWRVVDPDGNVIRDGLAMQSQASNVKAEYDAKQGQLYEARIPDDEDMLLFGKPITAQSNEVKAILKDSGLWKELKENLSDYASPSNTRGKLNGENIYNYLEWKLGSPKAASQRLLALGIPGIKYAGGTISGVKNVGFNYVIFDGADTEITNTFYSRGDGQIQGFYNPKTNEITLVADGIPKGRETGVALHEIFHRGESNLTPDQKKALTDQVNRWKNRKEGSNERKIYEAATARAEASGDAKGEFLTYAIEEARNLGIEPNAKKGTISAEGWLAKVKQFFTAALEKLAPTYKGELNADDLVDIAYGIAAKDAEQQQATGDQTQTPAFKKWFGDSSVVDENGKPKIFYHDGSSEFTGIQSGKGRFGGALFVKEGGASGYGDASYALFVRGPILELDEMAELLGNEGGREILEKAARQKLDDDQAEQLTDALTNGEDYPTDSDVWDLIGAIDEADAQKEIQMLRGRVAKGLGFGAVRTPDEFGGQTVMITDPSQIKSATGNDGSFDPANPDIRFSRTEQEVSEVEALFKGLDGKGMTKKEALAAIEGNPDADAIRFVEDNFRDLLSEIEDSGKVNIKC
jgi:hypothetical protein